MNMKETIKNDKNNELDEIKSYIEKKRIQNKALKKMMVQLEISNTINKKKIKKQ